MKYSIDDFLKNELKEKNQYMVNIFAASTLKFQFFAKKKERSSQIFGLTLHT